MQDLVDAGVQQHAIEAGDLMLEGQIAGEAQYDKMGPYELIPMLINDHPVYKALGDKDSYIYFANNQKWWVSPSHWMQV